MIAKAMDWIKQHAAPNIREIDGVPYSDKSMIRIKDVKDIDMVKFNTLTSLVDYLKSGVDLPNAFINHVFVNIDSPKHISVYSEANADNYYSRTQIAEVHAMLPDIKIGQWIDQTEFCIMLRANFTESFFDNTATIKTDRDALINVASNIISGTIAQYEDTGISQKATLKTGIQESEDRLLPEKVVLCPFRTFMEVEQPKSEFIFRAQDCRIIHGGGVEFSLFEADGGKWKLDAMAFVKKYLKEQLDGLDYITVTA